MRYVTALATTIVCLFFCAAADPLHNTKWKVTFTTDGEKPVEDVLQFTVENFTSDVWKKRGFPTIKYDPDLRGMGTVTFNANETSEAGGTLKWTGTIAIHEITGEVTWTKKDGSAVVYAFKGVKAP